VPAQLGQLARPARDLPEQRDGARLLVIDPASGRFAERRAAELPQLLRHGDLVVVNDAATLPASLAGRDPRAEPIELRLIARRGAAEFQAVLFGPGDWRQRTEDRPAPGRVRPGDRLQFGGPANDGGPATGAPELAAAVLAVSPLSPRLLEVRFDRDGAALWAALYRLGRVVQYAHLARPLPLWAVQNVYAGRPWAFEMPSAGRTLSWQLLLDLRRRGVALGSLTHAAGLSATGDPLLDARLPLPEAFELPAATVAAIQRTRQSGGRVVAVGTTVVRALEGAHRGPEGLRPGPGATDLHIGPATRPAVVDGLVSGLHAPGESHFALLSAFRGPSVAGRGGALRRTARLPIARARRRHPGAGRRRSLSSDRSSPYDVLTMSGWALVRIWVRK
jgi:S-adenosylmethionine:tRNA ribosyltransferase-isomerase